MTVKIFCGKESEIYFLLGIVNDIPSNSEPAVTITLERDETMSFAWKVVNIEMI